MNHIAQVWQVYSQQNESPQLKYKLLYQLFLECMDQLTVHSQLVFSGPFPKLQYVNRQCGVSVSTSIAINRFRVHAQHSNHQEQNILPDVAALVRWLHEVFHEVIPADVESCLPQVEHAPAHLKVRSFHHLRVSVTAVTDCALQVVSQDADMLSMQLFCGELLPKMPDGEAQCDAKRHVNRSYLLELVHVGSQLNLLDVKLMEDGVAQCAHVILEPDYLVDVSALARCFKDYGHEPVNHLIDLLMPRKQTGAILLGNFAGFALDKLLNHHDDEQLDYASTITSFVADYPLDFATCTDLGQDFHANAQLQLNNLKNIIHRQFPEMGQVDMNRFILEPTFLCEPLGLQGRIDLMQDDNQVVVEQKSGKKDFYTNGHRQEHYLQLLLYREMLCWTTHVPAHHLSAFLLYSRYPDGLILEGPAPDFLEMALKVRNELVAQQYDIAYGGIADILEHTEPEQLNTNQQSGKLWKDYQLPQIKRVLDTFKQADATAKAYFCRFFTFWAREHLLSKVGMNTPVNRGFAALWSSSYQERLQAGCLIDHLHLSMKKETMKGEGYDQLMFSFPEREDDAMPNFREGDVVILYCCTKNEVPSVREHRVMRGTLQQMTHNHLMVKLRYPQRNDCVFPTDEQVEWVVEQDMVESSFSVVYRSLFQLLWVDASRRQLLLAQREPEKTENYQLRGEYGALNTMVQRAMQANDYFLLIGPPGTGKTSYALVSLLKEELCHSQSQVLMVSFTNRAVDEICDKLEVHGIDYFRLGSDAGCAPSFRGRLFKNRASQCKKVSEVRQLILNTRVVVGTTASVTASADIFQLKHFTLGIIDESSQILEPQLMGILTANKEGVCAIDRFIFIGDERQLPAVVQQKTNESKVDDSLLRNICLTDCRRSLFERLIEREKRLQRTDFVYLLNRHGRMHPNVAEFPNQMFYHGQLESLNLEHQQRNRFFLKSAPNDKVQQCIATHRTLFVPSPSVPCHLMGEKSNAAEAMIIVRLLQAVYHLFQMNVSITGPFVPEKSLGVIVPYRSQIVLLRKLLATLGIDELNHITIDTVERYQGSERDVIVYGFTVSQAHQLDFITSNSYTDLEGKVVDRKLNVALTRAREHIIVVGNPQLLSANAVFAEMMNRFVQMEVEC